MFNGSDFECIGRVTKTDLTSTLLGQAQSLKVISVVALKFKASTRETTEPLAENSAKLIACERGRTETTICCWLYEMLCVFTILTGCISFSCIYGACRL